MRVQINGEAQQLPEDLTIAALLESLNLPAERVAVEHNHSLVQRGTFAAVRLSDGDQLEIVQIVGGG